jgi:hypothetical protein
VAFTALRASGDYCSDPEGRYAAECPTAAPLTHAHASGLYPSVAAGLSLDFARHLDSVFHGGRLAVDAAAGTMPTVVAGAQHDARPYAYGGATLTLGLGARQ